MSEKTSDERSERMAAVRGREETPDQKLERLALDAIVKYSKEMVVALEGKTGAARGEVFRDGAWRIYRTILQPFVATQDQLKRFDPNRLADRSLKMWKTLAMNQPETKVKDSVIALVTSLVVNLVIYAVRTPKTFLPFLAAVAGVALFVRAEFFMLDAIKRRRRLRVTAAQARLEAQSKLYTDLEKKMLLDFVDGGGFLCCQHDAGFIDRVVAEARREGLRNFAYENMGCEDGQTPATSRLSIGDRARYRAKLENHLTKGQP